MSPQTFFASLWEDYLRLAPRAGSVCGLFTEDNSLIVNDHVAFRTFRKDGIRRAQLEPLLLDLGYQRQAPYDFPERHVKAWAYTSPEPGLPRIFFSELDIEGLSLPCQRVLHGLLRNLRLLAVPDLRIFWAGRLWPMPSWADYQLLRRESEYAAWLAAIGLHANHFTLAVHELQPQLSLEAALARVEAAGFTINTEGGRIKGSPEALLEQASILADYQPYAFADGDMHDIPTAYYELARRYPDPTGQLYEGFIGASAAHLFTSTNHHPGRSLQ